MVYFYFKSFTVLRPTWSSKDRLLWLLWILWITMDRLLWIVKTTKSKGYIKVRNRAIWIIFCLNHGETCRSVFYGKNVLTFSSIFILEFLWFFFKYTHFFTIISQFIIWIWDTKEIGHILDLGSHSIKTKRFPWTSTCSEPFLVFWDLIRFSRI